MEAPVAGGTGCKGPAWAWLLRLALLVAAGLLAAGGLLASAPAWAAETPSRIVEMTVQGLTTVERAQVLNAVQSRVGGPIDTQVITHDIHNILALGFFQDVQVQAQELPGQGYRLIYVVREKPRIASITIKGNTLLETKKVDEALTLKVGGVFSHAELEENLDKIRRLYRDKGYFKVKISTKTEPISPTQYALTVQIEESPRIYITDIRVRGNHLFNSLEIRRMMQSAEVDCFDWIDSSGVFDEDKVNADLQAITSRYLALGYIRVFIDKPKVTLVDGDAYSKVIVELNITEGAQYFTGSLDVTGDILGNKQDLLDRLQLKTGQIYNPFLQNQDQFGLSEVYQEQGYAFVQVAPDRHINDATHIVDVAYRIHKGDKAYIGRIEFHGNRETRDYVMRREMQVREHELYNGAKLRQSVERLRFLGFFKPNIDVQTQPEEVGNLLDLNTRVEEQQTGTLQAQVGYSDVSGTLAALSISKANLGGRGQTA
ncbi:MAG TPA: outer membrane protein assembly factor BamA, partial [bacterium]|nr:outer membrane protein assembly factor BamA [bacterium]